MMTSRRPSQPRALFIEKCCQPGDGGDATDQSNQSHLILACPICGRRLRLLAGKRGTIVCPECKTPLLADTVAGTLKPKDVRTAEQDEPRSNDDEQGEKQTMESAEGLQLGPSMPDITSGTIIGRWGADEFLLLLVRKPRTIAEALGYKGPSLISYELTLAVISVRSQKAVMFISIERSSGGFLNLFAEALAKDEGLDKEMGSAKLGTVAGELSGSGTLCLGVQSHGVVKWI
jgi:uncharacterized protein YbaR (Trm112 family)